MELERSVVQLTGRVAALELMLAQVMIATLMTRADPGAALAAMRESFDERADNIEAMQPEALPAALEGAARIYGIVEEQLAARP